MQNLPFEFSATPSSAYKGSAIYTSTPYLIPLWLGWGPEDQTGRAGIMRNVEQCLAPPQTVVIVNLLYLIEPSGGYCPHHTCY